MSARVSLTGSQPATFDQTQYQEKSRKLVTLVNQLRDAGAQASFTLPSLVVCGNQSAGKSSLLERLCGVKLPRAAGTCTKCPTEVRLSTAPPGGSATWCCQVKLRKEYDKNNRKLQSKPREQDFKTLNQDSKDLLHFYVSAAQRALLNPDSPADTFVRDADKAGTTTTFSSIYDAESEDDLRFTRNVVVLEITGADVDLALIDLPGIIQTEQGDDGTNVELVKQLVEQYISSDRSIIVATITCKDDIDNQAIVQMARAADREGLRTIGVLTKADTIEPGTHGSWLRVLQGMNYPLRLGYFCVVNPSQEDINNSMTPEAAAAKELAFFRQDRFFSSEAVAAMKDRLGVDALRVQLSKQLVSLTQRELPKMKAALENVLAQTEMQLRKLPSPPTSDPSFELFSRLRDLATAVGKAVNGTDDATFFRAADASYRQFREAVLEARPSVRLTGLPCASNVSNSIFKFGEPHAPRATSPAVADANNAATESTLREEDPEFWLQGPALEGQEEPVGLITLEKVRQLAAKYRVKELPSFHPYRVLEELVQGLKGRWDAAALTCLQSVAEALQEMTDRAVDQHFGQFVAARREIRAVMYQLHERLMVNTTQHIKELMAMEQEHIWTQNDHYIVSSKQCFEELLVKQVYGSGKASKPNDVVPTGSNNWTAKSYVDNALAYLLQAGINLSAEDLDIALAKKQQKDSESEEGLLDLIAGTLAYYKVSSKRVIDGVPMHLRHYLLKQYCKELSDLPAQLAAGITAGSSISDTFMAAEYSNPLYSTGLGGVRASRLSSSDGGDGMPVAGDRAGSSQNPGAPLLDAKALMAEDVSTAERREQLHRQLKQLHSVRMILSVF